MSTSTTERVEETSTQETKRKDRLGLLRQRDFRLLWIGESTSTVGSAISGIALIAKPLRSRPVFAAPRRAAGHIASMQEMRQIVSRSANTKVYEPNTVKG